MNALCGLWMSFLIHIVARMKLNRTSWYLDVTHLQSSERSMNRLIFIANPSWKYTKIMLSSDNFYLCTTKPRCLLRGQIRPFTGFMYHMFNVHIRSLWSVDFSNPSVLLCFWPSSHEENMSATTSSRLHSAQSCARSALSMFPWVGHARPTPGNGDRYKKFIRGETGLSGERGRFSF